jgi:hypothetical protein
LCITWKFERGLKEGEWGRAGRAKKERKRGRGGWSKRKGKGFSFSIYRNSREI